MLKELFKQNKKEYMIKNILENVAQCAHCVKTVAIKSICIYQQLFLMEMIIKTGKRMEIATFSIQGYGYCRVDRKKKNLVFKMTTKLKSDNMCHQGIHIRFRHWEQSQAWR